MDLKPQEIEKVTHIGMIDGNPVRMVRTVGGFHFAIGRAKGKKEEEALAAGSHPAIVHYQVEKNHSEFQPALEKSESLEPNTRVTGFAELLPKELRQVGFDLVMLEKNDSTSLVLTRKGHEMNSFQCTIGADSVSLSKAERPVPAFLCGFSRAVAQAAAVKAMNEGKTFVDHDGQRFTAAKIMQGRR